MAQMNVPMAMQCMDMGRICCFHGMEVTLVKLLVFGCFFIPVLSVIALLVL